MKLSVIIVNYNVKYFLQQCLQSVQKACGLVDAEVFVVDKNNNNMLIRGIKMTLSDLINTNRLYVAHASPNEASTENRIFVRKFFSTIGYQILYDTNS